MVAKGRARVFRYGILVYHTPALSAAIVTVFRTRSVGGPPHKNCRHLGVTHQVADAACRQCGSVAAHYPPAVDPLLLLTWRRAPVPPRGRTRGRQPCTRPKPRQQPPPGPCERAEQARNQPPRDGACRRGDRSASDDALCRQRRILPAPSNATGGGVWQKDSAPWQHVVALALVCWASRLATTSADACARPVRIPGGGLGPGRSRASSGSKTRSVSERRVSVAAPRGRLSLCLRAVGCGGLQQRRPSGTLGWLDIRWCEATLGTVLLYYSCTAVHPRTSQQIFYNLTRWECAVFLTTTAEEEHVAHEK